MATSEVKKTLESPDRYGDSGTGVSFYALFERNKLFWTADKQFNIIIPICDPDVPNTASGRAIEWSFTNFALCQPFLCSSGLSVSQAYAHELKRTR